MGLLAVALGLTMKGFGFRILRAVLPARDFLNGKCWDAVLKTRGFRVGGSTLWRMLKGLFGLHMG